MTLRALRIGVMAVCVAAIGGMVAGSIASNDGLAITSGLVAGVAVVVLMAATLGAREAGAAPIDEEQAAGVEAQIQALVERGADETALRTLVGDAVRLGRGR